MCEVCICGVLLDLKDQKEEDAGLERTLYLFSKGKLVRKGNTLGLETASGTRFVPVEAVRDIMVFGEVEFNKRLLEFLSQHEILLHYFSHHGYYMGTFYPREHYNSGYIILKQAAAYLDSGERLKLARLFVSGSIRNMQKVLGYYNRRGTHIESSVNALDTLESQLDRPRSIPELMAVEGNARVAYFGAWDRIIDHPDFRFGQRSKRPPENRTNALLSFLNSLLYTTVLSEIYKTHLDPRIGYLHETNFRRFSLNLDIAEIFKPIIVDRLIFTLIGRRMIRPGDFRHQAGGIFLSESALKVIVEEYEKRLRTTIKVRKLRRHVSYRRLIRLEAYKVQKHVTGDGVYEPFVSEW